MRSRLAPALLLAALAVGGCSDSGDGESERPGSPAVYERIAGLTDCAAVQSEFDTASAASDTAEAGTDAAEVALAYMQAAQDQLEELGCV